MQNYCESVSEVIMRIWVKNSVRITAHGLRFPIEGLFGLGYTGPKKNLKFVIWLAMGENNKCKKLFF